MIRLPLSALKGMCCRRRRLQDFRLHHKKSAGEDSTWAEWLAVTPRLDDRLWAVMVALPRVYPEHRAELRKIPEEVAWRAATRAQAAFDAESKEALITKGTVALICSCAGWAAAARGALRILNFVSVACSDARTIGGIRNEMAKQLQDLDELLAKVLGGAL